MITRTVAWPDPPSFHHDSNEGNNRPQFVAYHYWPLVRRTPLRPSRRVVRPEKHCSMYWLVHITWVKLAEIRMCICTLSNLGLHSFFMLLQVHCCMHACTRHDRTIISAQNPEEPRYCCHEHTSHRQSRIYSPVTTNRSSAVGRLSSDK